MRPDEHLVTTARELGEAVKHFRVSAGMTQVDAAEALGVGQPYLSSLEAGKFGRSLNHVLRLLGFVGCEVIVRPRTQLTASGNEIDLNRAGPRAGPFMSAAIISAGIYAPFQREAW